MCYQIEAFKMLTCIVSSKEREREGVCVSRTYFSWSISWDQCCKEYAFENIGLEDSYCAGFREATFQNEKLGEGVSVCLHVGRTGLCARKGGCS